MHNKSKIFYSKSVKYTPRTNGNRFPYFKNGPVVGGKCSTPVTLKVRVQFRNGDINFPFLDGMLDGPELYATIFAVNGLLRN